MSHHDEHEPPATDTPAPRPAEALLIDALSRILDTPPPHRLLCTSLGRAQLAAAVAQRLPAATVDCHFWDLHQADSARQLWTDLPNLTIHCTANFSAGPFDTVLLPLQATGDAEFTRDLLQAACLRLPIGGKLWASTDNPSDHWLHAELQKFFGKVTAHRQPLGVVFAAEKRAELKKVKKFDCEFAFRDGERLIKAFSRPGVFSHRHLDLGARALIEAMDIWPGDRVLDLGCGAGSVALAAAARSPDVSVLAVDSNPRAIECTVRGAELNGLTNIQTRLDASGSCDQPHSFDLVLGNPPYYSRHRIADIFLRGAEMALKPDGLVLIVTKDAEWYRRVMPDRFANVTVEERRGYSVLIGAARK